MASIDTIFASTYHTKQLNPWSFSLASRVVNYCQLSACQGEIEPFKDHLSTCGCLTNLRNKPQQKQPGQLSVPMLAELLVNVQSYRLMVKSTSCCCVCGSQVFSDPVTYMYLPEISLFSLMSVASNCITNIHCI